MIKQHVYTVTTEHKEELAASDKEFEDTLKRKEAKFKAAMRVIKRNHEDNIDKLKMNHTMELDQLCSSYAASIISNPRSKVMQDNRQLKQQIVDMEDSIDERLRYAEAKHQEHLHEVLDELNKAKKDVKRLTRELTQKQDEITKMMQTKGLSD